MIEVIKHGKNKFTATCADCGCEFSYDIEDVNDGKIVCPDCHKEFPHIMTSGYISAPIYFPPNCVKIKYPPKDILFVDATTTDVRKNVAVLTKTQPDWAYREDTITSVDKE